jgi:hypothetical protein
LDSIKCDHAGERFADIAHSEKRICHG